MGNFSERGHGENLLFAPHQAGRTETAVVSRSGLQREMTGGDWRVSSVPVRSASASEVWAFGRTTAARVVLRSDVGRGASSGRGVDQIADRGLLPSSAQA